MSKTTRQTLDILRHKTPDVANVYVPKLAASRVNLCGLPSNSRKAMPTLVIVAANVKVLATSGADGKLARSNTTL